MYWSTIGCILRARWLIISVVTMGALAGGLYVVLMATPLYEASARVMLNVYRPDPITGARLGKRTIDPYIETQLNLIRDFQVIVPAIEAAGWLDDPDVLAAYAEANDPQPLEIWAALNVIDSLRTTLVDDTNIIEISVRGQTPEGAELVAGTIRDAYITASINMRRYSAMDDAERQTARLNRLREELADLQAQQRAIESEVGVMLGQAGTDAEGDALMALARPDLAAAKSSSPTLAIDTTARAALAKLDSDIALASESLGPNHPQLVQLKAQRAAALARAELEEHTGGGVASTALAYERAKQAQLEARKSRVLEKRLDVLRVRLAQDRVKLKAAQLKQATQQIAYFRQLATAVESGITSTGRVEVKPSPVFPSVPLILGGTGGIGLVAGILVALLVEMLDRRVRSVPILRNAVPGLPVLGAIPRLEPTREKPPRRRTVRAFRSRKPAVA